MLCCTKNMWVDESVVTEKNKRKELVGRMHFFFFFFGGQMCLNHKNQVTFLLFGNIGTKKKRSELCILKSLFQRVASVDISGTNQSCHHDSVNRSDVSGDLSNTHYGTYRSVCSDVVCVV